MKDAFVVRNAYNVLKEAGYRCFLDSDDLTLEYSSSFHDSILSAINNSHCFLFFYSENSIGSKFAKHELYHAKKKNIPILTIRLDDSFSSDSIIEYSLSDLNFLDFSTMENDWAQRLLNAARGILR